MTTVTQFLTILLLQRKALKTVLAASEGREEQPKTPRQQRLKVRNAKNGDSLVRNSRFCRPKRHPPQSVAPEMCRKPCKKNDANEERKRAHDTLWGEYFGSQVVPGRGIKGEVNLPLGRGKVKCNFFSNTPWAAGPANFVFSLDS